MEDYCVEHLQSPLHPAGPAVKMQMIQMKVDGELDSFWMDPSGNTWQLNADRFGADIPAPSG